MANKLYTKEGMNFEGISMQEGKSSPTLKLLGFMIVTAIVLGVLIFTAGSYFAGQENKPENNAPQITILPTSTEKEEVMVQEESSPTPSLKVTTSPTPKVTAKVTSKVTTTVTPTSTTTSTTLKVEVLNGSGVKGAAGKLSTSLKNAGYTVLSTGNAESFDYKGVSVNIKKSKAKQLDQLKKDLSASDYLVTESASTLAESSNADIEIILGSQE